LLAYVNEFAFRYNRRFENCDLTLSFAMSCFYHIPNSTATCRQGIVANYKYTMKTRSIVGQQYRLKSGLLYAGWLRGSFALVGPDDAPSKIAMLKLIMGVNLEKENL
jgi:hypothetical protein